MTNEQIALATLERLEETQITQLNELPKQPAHVHVNGANVVLRYSEGRWAHLAAYTQRDDDGASLFLWDRNAIRHHLNLYADAGLISEVENLETLIYLEQIASEARFRNNARAVIQYLTEHPEQVAEFAEKWQNLPSQTVDSQREQ